MGRRGQRSRRGRFGAGGAAGVVDLAIDLVTMAWPRSGESPRGRTTQGAARPPAGSGRLAGRNSRKPMGTSRRGGPGGAAALLPEAAALVVLAALGAAAAAEALGAPGSVARCCGVSSTRSRAALQRALTCKTSCSSSAVGGLGDKSREPTRSRTAGLKFTRQPLKPTRSKTRDQSRLTTTSVMAVAWTATASRQDHRPVVEAKPRRRRPSRMLRFSCENTCVSRGWSSQVNFAGTKIISMPQRRAWATTSSRVCALQASMLSTIRAAGSQSLTARDTWLSHLRMSLPVMKPSVPDQSSCGHLAGAYTLRARAVGMQLPRDRGIQICGSFVCSSGWVQIVAMSQVRGHAGWPR